MSNQNEIQELCNLILDENTDGSIDKIIEYSKDENGNIISAGLDFDCDGVVDSHAYIEYDAQGRIVKKSIDKNSDGKIDSVTIYEYDHNGNVSTYYDDNADGKVDYIETQDENGNITLTDERGNIQKIVEVIKNIFS